jgi:ankyrin repeat protein
MSKLAKFTDWPESPFPRSTATPRPHPFQNPMETEKTEMETKYLRRVHDIVEYLVPVQYCANHFGNSRLPLIQAVGQGDLHWVRQILLKTDTDPDTRSFQGWTALQQACSIENNSPESRDQEAIVKLLISHGSHVNAAPGIGYSNTALQAACECGNEKVVNILLEKGADVHADAGELAGKSALASASWAGHFGIVKKLLDLGADVNQSGSEELGHTALSAAAQLGNLEMVNFLLENGASVQGSSGLLALEKAIFWNQLEVTRRLLELGLDVNSAFDGSAPVHSVQSLEMLNLVVAYGARFDLPCSKPYEKTALQRAARYQSLELVVKLILLGSDIHCPGPALRGRTTLQSAAARRDEEGFRILQLLIEEHGVDVNEPRSEEEGYTSLEAACHETVQDDDASDIMAVEFLVGRGAVITPFTLHIAAAWNHTKLVEFLLQNGARGEDINSSTNIEIVYERVGAYRYFGQNVIETAKINGHLELAEGLKKWPNSYSSSKASH